MLKQATASLLVLGAATVGVDASVLNEKPVHAEYQLKEHVSVVQRGDVVEATLPWKDQPGIKVKYDMGKPTAKEKRDDKRKRQVVVEQVNADAMKIDVLLNEKPDTNQFCYTIEGWEDYDFFYQPALTPEEIAEGAERPEEIVGSYAVYHKTLKNHRVGSTNYETGKVAHIPYPYIWSVNATSTKHRAEAFDITDGRMCVTVAQSDLDGMEYPIRVDPTFGYTTLGASTDSNSLGASVNDTSSHSGDSGENDVTEIATVTQISLGIISTSITQTTDLFAAIYDEDSSGADSHDLVASGEIIDQVISTTASFYNITASGTVPVGNTIIAGIVNGEKMTAGAISPRYDTTSGHRRYSESTTGAGSYTTRKAENPWTEVDGASSRRFSFYATYTASGSSTPLIDSGAVIFE